VVVQVVSANTSQREYVPLTNPPKDYLLYSIFGFMCCFFPFGKAAVDSSVNCKVAIAVGDREKADIESRQAYRQASWAVVIGSVLTVVLIIVSIITVVAVTRTIVSKPI
jgi:Interferon-induced transmembrane protein